MISNYKTIITKKIDIIKRVNTSHRSYYCNPLQEIGRRSSIDRRYRGNPTTNPRRMLHKIRIITEYRQILVWCTSSSLSNIKTRHLPCIINNMTIPWTRPALSEACRAPHQTMFIEGSSTRWMRRSTTRKLRNLKRAGDRVTTLLKTIYSTIAKDGCKTMKLPRMTPVESCSRYLQHLPGLQMQITNSSMLVGIKTTKIINNQRFTDNKRTSISNQGDLMSKSATLKWIRFKLTVHLNNIDF